MARDIEDWAVQEAYDWVMAWEDFPKEPRYITNDDVVKKCPPFPLDRDHWMGVLKALKELHSLYEN